MVKSVKVVVILQLCLVFSVAMWTLAGPFMMQYVTGQSSLLLHRAVVGDASGGGEKARRADYFQNLEADDQQRILASMEKVQASNTKGFWQKSGEAAKALLIDLPAFTQAWLFFSFLVCLFLLLRIDGAAKAAWVLPLIALAYAFDNRTNGIPPISTPDLDLFPSEQYIVERYRSEPLSGDHAQQRQQLQDAWERYLVVEWNHEPLNSDQASSTLSVEKAEHAFNTARLKRYLDAEETPQMRSLQHSQKSLLLLVVYFAWNLFFAFYVNRKETPCA